MSTALTSRRQQLERARRWYERFKTISDGRPHISGGPSSENLQDEVYAFFQNCYHVKDWIKNDAPPGLVAKNVEGFIKNDRDMRLCADLANGTKHLKLTNPKGTEKAEFGARHAKLELGGVPQLAMSYSIVSQDGGGPDDAFEVAGRCMRAWDKFFDDHGL